jgi:molybdenum cofactor cytidylyltransferase
MGLDPGEVITPLAATRLLASPAGLLRDFPAQADAVVLLNKADVLSDPAASGLIARNLSPMEVVVAGRDLEPRRYPRVASIILAAGSSTRLGRPKQLLRYKGTSLVRRAVELALAAALHPVILVVGARAPEVLAEVEDLVAEGMLTTVENRDYELGQSSSLHAGLALVPDWADGALMQLVDQPFLHPKDLTQPVDRFAETGAPAVVPTAEGKRGSPVLFRADQFPALKAVTGDQGGRGILQGLGDVVLEVPLDDPRAAIDIDTPEAARLLEED